MTENFNPESDFKPGVYRAMKKLGEAAAIHEAAGMVCVSGAAK